MNRIKRSSKKWSFPKRKLGPDTIVDKNFDIMSDGQHCFYLCKKKKLNLLIIQKSSANLFTEKTMSKAKKTYIILVSLTMVILLSMELSNYRKQIQINLATYLKRT